MEEHVYQHIKMEIIIIIKTNIQTKELLEGTTTHAQFLPTLDKTYLEPIAK